GLRELGLAPGDRVAILSPNRPEWAAADLASLLARCVDVPLYPTLPPKHLRHILHDSGASAVFVSDAEEYAKIAEIRSELPGLRHVIPFDTVPWAQDVFPFSRLLQLGSSAEARYPSLMAEGMETDPDTVVT